MFSPDGVNDLSFASPNPRHVVTFLKPFDVSCTLPTDLETPTKGALSSGGFENHENDDSFASPVACDTGGAASESSIVVNESLPQPGSELSGVPPALTIDIASANEGRKAPLEYSANDNCTESKAYDEYKGGEEDASEFGKGGGTPGFSPDPKNRNKRKLVRIYMCIPHKPMKDIFRGLQRKKERLNCMNLCLLVWVCGCPRV